MASESRLSLVRKRTSATDSSTEKPAFCGVRSVKWRAYTRRCTPIWPYLQGFALVLRRPGAPSVTAIRRVPAGRPWCWTRDPRWPDLAFRRQRVFGDGSTRPGDARWVTASGPCPRPRCGSTSPRTTGAPTWPTRRRAPVLTAKAVPGVQEGAVAVRAATSSAVADRPSRSATRDADELMQDWGRNAIP